MIINRRYDIKSKLGEGRSQVFLVIDKYYPEQLFAMKLISHNSAKKEIQSFKDEYYLLKSFEHKNIVKPFFNGTVFEISGVNDLNVATGDYFFTMELVKGKVLSDIGLQTRKKYLSEIVSQITSVLFYLHQSNLIYYDLKPENIIMSEDGVIKFIDFGFTEEKSNVEIDTIKGTPQLISPEILTQKVVDSRTDIYSFGALLYWLEFDKYPFDSVDELEIYKNHISGEVNFPSDAIKPELKFVIEKAMKKSPDERFENVLQLYYSFEKGNIKLEPENFINVNKYYSFPEHDYSIRQFFDSDSEFVLEIVGEKKSGKTRLLEKVNKMFESVLILDFAANVGTKEIWKRVLLDLLFMHSIPVKMFESLSNYIENYFNHPNEKMDELILTLFSRISSDYKFVFLIDNCDKADESSVEILKKLLRMLAINKIKSVITASKNLDELFQFDRKQLKLNQLSESEIHGYINFLFFEKFPKEELIYLIKKYSEKYFGSINDFIKKLLQLNIISYSTLLPKINLQNFDESKINLDSQKNLDEKCKYLTNDESLVLSVISSFEKMTIGLIQKITDFESGKVEQILDKLESLQILFERRRILAIKFIADNFAGYFYDKIPDKKSFHYFLAGKISDDENVSTDEKIFHLEKSQDYETALKIIDEEIIQLESFSAFAGIEKYLQKIISYPIDRALIEDYKIKLIENYLKMAAFNKARNLLDKIDYGILAQEKINFIEYLRGKILYGLGNNLEALQVFQFLSSKKTFHDLDLINIELASVYIDISDFKNSKNICEMLLANESMNPEIKARALNLLALINIYDTNNFKEAAELFQKSIKIYEKINNKSRLAGLELNLGNVLHILGDARTAFEHWEKSQQLNKNIGNFQQEADSTLGMGVYEFNNFNIDHALEKYLRANTIYRTIGNKLGAGLSYYNLSECNIFSLEYKNAIENIQSAISLFSEIGNENELISTYFLQAMLNIKLDLIDDNLSLEEKIQSSENIVSSEIYLSTLRVLYKLKNGKSDDDVLSQLIQILSQFYDEKNLFIISLIFLEILKLDDEKQKGRICREIVSFPIFEEMKHNNYINSFYLAFNYFLPIGENFEIIPLKYLINAFEKLKTETITELTIIVIYEIASNYVQNGNLWKAKEYFDFLISLTDFAQQKIKEVIPQFSEKTPSYIKKIKDFISKNSERFAQ